MKIEIALEHQIVNDVKFVIHIANLRQCSERIGPKRELDRLVGTLQDELNKDHCLDSVSGIGLHLYYRAAKLPVKCISYKESPTGVRLI